MNFLELAQTRHTTKAYDQTKKIPHEQLEQLLEVLRLSPSSINIQPWRFLVAQSEQAKQNITQATQGAFAYNIPKILNASEVIIFTAKTHIDAAHLDNILSHEEQAGRFRTPEAKDAQKNTRQTYIDLYRSQNMIDSWVDNQIHIALGMLLSAAKSMHIDATAMGGFDHSMLDEVFGLKQYGLRSVVMTALGYRSTDDFNAHLPKARLSRDDVIQIF
ncbi:MAG: oxygen-insensitive NAD(P)H nitroreductase [Acinetobacter sp.]|mgnify:CR=1 FL=1|nr:MAG: oxygen-insensitive NAD(P)H nitroreductase [Acinetobacter sp.]